MAMICGWEGNRWSGVALAMRHRLCVIGLDIKILYRLNSWADEQSSTQSILLGGVCAVGQWHR